MEKTIKINADEVYFLDNQLSLASALIFPVKMEIAFSKSWKAISATKKLIAEMIEKREPEELTKLKTQLQQEKLLPKAKKEIEAKIQKLEAEYKNSAEVKEIIETEYDVKIWALNESAIPDNFRMQDAGIARKLRRADGQPLSPDGIDNVAKDLTAALVYLLV